MSGTIGRVMHRKRCEEARIRSFCVAARTVQ